MITNTANRSQAGFLLLDSLVGLALLTTIALSTAIAFTKIGDFLRLRAERERFFEQISSLRSEMNACCENSALHFPEPETLATRCWRNEEQTLIQCELESEVGKAIPALKLQTVRCLN